MLTSPSKETRKNLGVLVDDIIIIINERAMIDSSRSVGVIVTLVLNYTGN